MINSVRNTVLSVINKNNYGYITPADFNLFAKQAQMEIYEEYYSSYNKTINMENARMSGTDYADIQQPIAETLESFLVTDFLSNIGGNIFSAPTVSTVGNSYYYILKVLCNLKLITSGSNTSVVVNELNDSAATFITDGIGTDYVVANLDTGKVATVISVVSNTSMILSDDIFLASGDDYKIFSSAVNEADKVSVGKITMLNASNLTQPSEMYPSYTLEGESIKMYPKTINTLGQVQAVYFRFPKDPKWTYITIGNGEPMFDQSQPDYQDFELPLEDEYKLVMKILQYSGVSIREQEVTAYALGQEQHEQPTFSQQQ
jgi:hypothetical protein